MTPRELGRFIGKNGTSALFKIRIDPGRLKSVEPFDVTHSFALPSDPDGHMPSLRSYSEESAMSEASCYLEIVRIDKSRTRMGFHFISDARKAWKEAEQEFLSKGYVLAEKTENLKMQVDYEPWYDQHLHTKELNKPRGKRKK